jgi:hypothetical protein
MTVKWSNNKKYEFDMVFLFKPIQRHLPIQNRKFKTLGYTIYDMKHGTRKSYICLYNFLPVNDKTIELIVSTIVHENLHYFISDLDASLKLDNIKNI